MGPGNKIGSVCSGEIEVGSFFCGKRGKLK